MIRRSYPLFLLFITTVCLLPALNVRAQLFCPANINFEQGSLANWKFDTALNNGASGITTPVNVTPISTRHALTSGATTDYYGSFPIVDPNGGSFSLKLGNDAVRAQVDRARYTFTIPANVNNYSLIYRYAVVFENPTSPVHTSSEQPYFKVRVYDSATGTTINCASFTYVSQGGLPGFSTSTHTGTVGGAVVYYRPWSTASLNLSGQAGKTLVLEFTTADCALGGHMGYGYVDVSCGLFAITGTTCNPTSPLTAPAGFQTYTWYNASYSTVIGTGQTITVTTPTVLSQYHVVLTPYPGYGCQDTLHTQLVGSTLALAQMPDTMLCNNPSVTLNPVVSGNVPPFTYSWTPATGLSCTTCASPTASPTINTNYILTVTDSFGCVRRDTVLVRAKPTVIATAAAALCYGAANGSVSAVAAQGTPPFTYSWNSIPPQTGAAATNLPAGSYTVTATDTKGCAATQSATVTQPTPLVAAITSKDSVSCNGGADGKAIAIATGGIAPYTYSWNTTPVQTGTTAAGLSGGMRIVTVTDSHSCTDTESVQILQPSPLAVTVSLTSVNCYGGNNGTVIAVGNGGTPPYTYAIDAGGFGSNSLIAGLSAGAHIVHVKDAHGCTKDTGITITQPAPLALSWTTTQPLCYGAANGAISANGTGGTSPYQYALGSGTFGSATSFSALSAGSYVLHLKDAKGCTADSNVVVSQPTALSITLSPQAVLCNGGNSGSVSIAASGGTPAYTYAIGTAAFGSAASFNNLAAGSYALHLKDANGCTKDTAITITQPAKLNISYTATQPLCNGAANGNVTIAGIGGTTPYQYALNAGAYGTSAAFGGLSAGSYVLHVQDANGCVKDSNVTLSQPTLLTVSLSKTNVSCNGGANGSATVTAVGGTTPYAYSWTGSSATSATAASLSSGSYSVTVTDNKGCTATGSASITQPTAITGTTSAVAPVCNGNANGSASVSVSGGTSPYTYSWTTSPAQAGSTATGLLSGGYGVTVTDAAGCTKSFNAAVPVTPTIIVSVIPYWVSCNGGTDGSAKALAFNGNAPYTFSWSTTPAQTGDSAIRLKAGTYTVNVTSANGCPCTGTVTVQEPAILDAMLTPTPTCPGIRGGSISAVVSGGNTPCSYSWSNAQTGAALNGLDTGSYFLTVTDGKGCKDTAAAIITAYAAPQVSAGPDDTVCRGSGITLQGGGAKSYLWSPAGTLSCTACPSPIAMPLQNTTYAVVGTDEHGCKGTDTVKIAVIQRAPVSVGEKLVICPGDSVRLGAAGGVAWHWLPPVDSSGILHPTVWPTETTRYQIIITENRCFKDTLTQEVEVVPLPTVNLGPDIEAPKGAVVTINAVTTNAVSIAWSPAEGLSCTDNCFSPQHTVMGPVTYVALVKNSLGCPATDTIAIRDQCDEHYFYFANMFSPNGDGANDRFYPQGVGSFPAQHFMIYDRWGEIVFSATNISVNDAAAGWDGTFKGQALKPDVYVYVMDAVCENGRKVVIRGDVTLIR